MVRRGCLVLFCIAGVFVPSLVHAQCPRDRRIPGITCRQCPEGSRCIGRQCCWHEQPPVSAPCDDPMTRGSTFVTCDPGRRGRSARACPGRCHSCKDLSGVGMGLCCPEINRPRCESASPAHNEFQRAAERIRSGGGEGVTSSGGRGDPDFGIGTSPRDRSRSQSRDTTSRRISPTSRPRVMMLRPDPVRPSSPCGVGVRPLGTCNYRIPMMPPCQRGLYCVPAGFMEVCCPVGTGPGSRSDPRFGSSRFGGSSERDRFSSRGVPGSFPSGGRSFGGSSSSGRTEGSFGGSRRSAESDLFGPLPSYDFPMGPNDPRTRRRGRCPRRVTCVRTGDDECYMDSHCAAPFRCCSAGRGCANRCLLDESSFQ